MRTGRTDGTSGHIEQRITASREVDPLVDAGSTASVQAEVLAGIAGFAAFLLAHHALILPIWFITPVGGVLAAVGGAAVGAAYADLLPYLPRRPWTALGVMLVVGAILLPALALTEYWGPVDAIPRPHGGPPARD
jgi:hypothetical protein